jgi:hypothetical protein
MRPSGDWDRRPARQTEPQMMIEGVSRMTPQLAPVEDQTELLLRASRQALFVVLVMVLVLGTTLLANAIWPGNAIAEWPARLPWLIPVSAVAITLALRMQLRGRKWDPNAPEVKAIEQDEFRKANLDRARKASLIIVLIAQLPFAFAFLRLSTFHALMAMATSTITLGMASMIAFFLFFDRDQSNE